MLRRRSPVFNFNRGWSEYVSGFGEEKSDYWMGLDRLHVLTSTGAYGLRVDLERWNKQKKWPINKEKMEGPS